PTSPLSLPDALPISGARGDLRRRRLAVRPRRGRGVPRPRPRGAGTRELSRREAQPFRGARVPFYPWSRNVRAARLPGREAPTTLDRKSTRLNSITSG